jgi:RIO-like serine/threonine protein kinase
MDHGLDETALISWVETSLRDNSHTLAAGYQGKTLEYHDKHQHLVIKVPHGRGLIKYIHTLMLRHEHRVYQQLAGFSASPKCYGMLANTYLVLEYIDARPIRERRPGAPEKFFALLLDQIEEMHRRQVAHMDLKKKDNLMVTVDQQPCIIDFGTSVIYKQGFHPLNHFWYKLAKQFDYNAWIKHKYHNNEINISKQDSQHYRRTIIERTARRLKSSYLATLNYFR